jgi:glycosyltransferase involved in cell wall biosynthesis
MSPPSITIVTPSFNRAGMIREAIESVLAQAYPSIEHIIVDGASTDGTLEALREYPHLQVISEPDSGMYEAIDKGLRMARGEIVGLLNTDDLYVPGAFSAVADAFAAHPEALAAVGGAEIFSTPAGGPEPLETYPPIGPGEFWYRVIEGHPVTNAWFFRSEVFERVGVMDTGYRFSADREFLIRAALAGVRPIPIPMILYRYRQHPGSATISAERSRDAKRGSQRLLVIEEGMRLLEGFLGQDGVPADVRGQLRHAHSVTCYRGAATSFYHRRFRMGFHAIRQGLRYDPLWSVVFLRRAWHRLLQEFGLRQPI